MSTVVEVKKYRIRSGIGLHVAARELIAIAQLQGIEVETEFNGCQLSIFPSDTVETVLERWDSILHQEERKQVGV